jgi:hypothetical protein
MNATMIRHRQIGKHVGVVITTSHSNLYEAHFQLYMAGMPGAATLMMASTGWNDEAGAIENFDAWVTEANLLVACGDM